MNQPNDSGLNGSIWAAAPNGYNTRNNRSRYWSDAPQDTSTTTQTPSQPSFTSAAHRAEFTPTSYRPPAPSKDITPTQALHRVEQTCLRLRWKSIDLEASYNRVLNAEDWNFPKDVAERNFKIDFYEFYAWIEQAIELLHRVCGVEILSMRTAGVSGSASHSFHYNVIRELQDQNHPLHEVMGRGEVNAALWKAKDLRNKWKEGGEDVPLGMYDLKWIVGKVLEGLELGYGRASLMVQLDGNGSGGGPSDGRDDFGWMIGESMDVDDA